MPPMNETSRPARSRAPLRRSGGRRMLREGVVASTVPNNVVPSSSCNVSQSAGPVPDSKSSLPAMCAFTADLALPRTRTNVPLKLKSTVNGATFAGKALLDSGATNCFIDRKVAEECGIHLDPLARAVPLFNVDGTPNSAGSVRFEAPLRLDVLGTVEVVTFAVADLGHEKVILGHDWLIRHNPVVNWRTGEVRMSAPAESRHRPPCCRP